MELSEIALQKLLQLFPEISSYIVSFQDITEEAGKEESGLQIGLYILQFGQENYYIPIIAKNDTVLPIDSLFSFSEGTFFPLTRSYIEKLMASSQVYLGKKAKIPPTVTQNPSVHDLVVPPRTGKYVYASSSRLVEFLAIMPDMVKKAMVEKFSEDKEVYQTLHRMFGLENVLAALKPSSPIKVVAKPAVEILTHGSNLDSKEIASILDKGYVLRGTQHMERIAVLANEGSKLGPLKNISGADVGADYTIVMKSGETKSAYIPLKTRGTPQKPRLLYSNDDTKCPVFALFADGSFATSGNFVARGEGFAGKEVMKDYFYDRTPMVPKQVTNQTNRIALFSPSLELIAALSVYSVVETVDGTTISGHSLSPGEGSITVNAYRNCRNVDVSNPSSIFVPANTLVIELTKDRTNELEVNVNAALAKLELNTLSTLGTSMDMGYDGIEFTIDGKPIGSEISVIEMLVGREGIAPEKAEHFIKQAKEQRRIKVYMSKKADFEPGEIPQYGDAPPEQVDNFGVNGANGAFKNNLRAATETQDAQVVESMVISELLQATDMNPLVKEYLPEIQAAIDKIGRILFLARLNMDKLSESQNSNEVMSFIANLRNVYRLLGDNATKLERMVSGPEQAQEEAGAAK
jgi:hypothetical protein